MHPLTAKTGVRFPMGAPRRPNPAMDERVAGSPFRRAADALAAAVMKRSSVRTDHDSIQRKEHASVGKARGLRPRFPGVPALRRTPGADVCRAVRARVAAKCVFETLAPASPLFERLMGVLGRRRLRIQTFGPIQEHLLGGLPTLTVDAAQLIGFRVHLVPIFEEMPQLQGGLRNETW